MTKQEKIERILESLMDNWGSQKDFDNFVLDILRNGFCGFEKLSDDEINQEYAFIFDFEEETE